MPVELIYLVVLLITICIFFIVLKRPIYEGMLAGYIVMVALTGQWANQGRYGLCSAFGVQLYGRAVRKRRRECCCDRRFYDSRDEAQRLPRLPGLQYLHGFQYDGEYDSALRHHCRFIRRSGDVIR